MVTFCTGSARQKRAYFMNDKDAVFLDNTEVLFCASEDGKNYFAYGDLPFADFTVSDYLNYARALKSEKVTRQAIEDFGISPDIKIKKLSPVQYRCVQFLEKTRGAKQKKLVINLDGAKFSKKSARGLAALISKADEVYVCVTDDRYITRYKRDCKVLSFGKSVKKSKPKFYSARILAKRIGAKRIAIM
ncbi:MAG: hypothetical protein J1G04_06810 [Clostridiales bacterium]|nr:hypothetical protein [Clostridiales bacterium]